MNTATSTTTTRDECVKNDIMLRNQLVSEMFDSIGGMAYNFARKFNLEVEDCKQEAALAMLEVWDRIPDDCRDIRAYLVGCVKYQLYDLLKRRGQESLSLDAPITPDSTESFADMLQAFVQQDSQRSEQVTKTVHNALRGLSLEVQLHTRDFYNLGDYKPALPRKSVKVAYGRKKEYMRKSLTRAFRKDPQVLSLLQQETAIL